MSSLEDGRAIIQKESGSNDHGGALNHQASLLRE